MHPQTTSLSPVRRTVVAVALAATVVACGPGEDAPEPAAPEPLSAAPEPAEAPDLGAEPAGLLVPVGTAPEGVVVDSTTGRVVVGVRDPDGVAVLDLDGNLVRRVELDGSPRHLFLSGAGGPVLVPAEGSDQLVQVDLPDGEVASVTPVGRNPHDAVAVGSRSFTADEFAEQVSVIEGGEVVEVVPAPLQPGGINAAAGKVAVVGVRARQTKVFDAETLEEVATVPTGEGPTHIEGAGDRLYVADTNGDAVLVLSVSADSVEEVARLDLPGAPYSMAVDAQRQRLWVTLTERNEVVALDISGPEPEVVTTLPAARQPNGVAVNGASGTVYVTGTADGVLQIIPAELTG